MCSLSQRCSAANPATWLLILVLAVLTVSCGDADDETRDTDLSTSAVQADLPASALTSGMTWQWQLQGELDTSFEVDMYDVDLFDTSAAQISALKADNRIVVCYFSAGSFEEWRSDASTFPDSAVGNTLDGWDDERWLDVRDPTVRAAMGSRLDLAVTKGCDGVEPDNVTATNNDSGFAISAGDQLDFNRFLAEAAHERRLVIGLKNDVDQIPELVAYFDFAVNEECHQYNECDVYKPFTDAGKPVFNAEYDPAFVADPTLVCERSALLGLSTLVLDIELDNSVRIAC